MEYGAGGKLSKTTTRNQLPYEKWKVLLIWLYRSYHHDFPETYCWRKKRVRERVKEKNEPWIKYQILISVQIEKCPAGKAFSNSKIQQDLWVYWRPFCKRGIIKESCRSTWMQSVWFVNRNHFKSIFRRIVWLRKQIYCRATIYCLISFPCYQ